MEFISVLCISLTNFNRSLWSTSKYAIVSSLWMKVFIDLPNWNEQCSSDLINDSLFERNRRTTIPTHYKNHVLCVGSASFLRALYNPLTRKGVFVFSPVVYSSVFRIRHHHRSFCNFSRFNPLTKPRSAVEYSRQRSRGKLLKATRNLFNLPLFP